MQLLEKLYFSQSCDVHPFFGFPEPNFLDGDYFSGLQLHKLEIRGWQNLTLVSLTHLFVGRLEDDTKGAFSKCCTLDVLIHRQ